MFNNETGLYVVEPEVMEGLWLEQDASSKLFNDNCPYFFIVACGNADNEGPDHVSYVDGPFMGQYVDYVLNMICRAHDLAVNPREWDVDWKALGFIVIPDHLKRFSKADGYYHA